MFLQRYAFMGLSLELDLDTSLTNDTRGSILGIDNIRLINNRAGRPVGHYWN